MVINAAPIRTEQTAPTECPVFDHHANEDLVGQICGSRYFDLHYYCKAVGVQMQLREAAEHFLARGEALGLNPGPEFDAAFYKKIYPDVAAAGINSLEHFLRWGEGERRCPTTCQLERDISVISGSGLFDLTLYAKEAGKHFFSQNDAIRHYLYPGELGGLKPCSEFNGVFYRAAYHDVRGNAFSHYLSVGIYEGRIACQEKLDRLLTSTSMVSRFDAERYRERVGLQGQTDKEALTHYLMHGIRLGAEPCLNFDADCYRENNPDIGSIQWLHTGHLFEHYCAHGQREGRIAAANVGDYLKAGRLVFDADKKTCLCVNHEASRTGAPLVGLNLVRSLSRTYNVITLVGRRGELDPAFARFSFLYGAYPFNFSLCKQLLKQLLGLQHIEFAIANSVETLTFVQALSAQRIPVVSLIHEFAEYTMPTGKVAAMVAASDRCIFPAGLVYQSLQSELKRCAYPSIQPSNCVIKPQGLLPFFPRIVGPNTLSVAELRNYLHIGGDADVKVVVGAGFVQPRKGVDIFVQTAVYFRRIYGEDFRFLWVGEGYNPEHDLQYSIWIKDAIVRADLRGHVFFLEAQKDLDAVLQLADVFFLSSRLDPFPNVVIDALQANVPVVCFADTTGAAEFLLKHRAPAYVAAYLDAHDAAAGIAKCLDADWCKGLPQGGDIVNRELNFEQYMTFVAKQVALAQELRANQAQRLAALADSHLFDPLFYTGKCSPERRDFLVGQCLCAADSGVLTYGPAPGFDPFLGRNGWAVLESERVRPTHTCYHFSEAARIERSADLRVAVHIHLHYADVASDFVNAFSRWQEHLAFFISTTSETDVATLKREFEGFPSLKVVCCQNRGRNFGPLLVGDLPDELAEFDVVGHFHGKKTVHAGDESLGRSWRDFLVGSLIGHRGECLAFILEKFAQDKKLGLLFPEDRHLVGWGDNWDYAHTLVKRMGLSAEPPGYCRFPVGSMFWARPAVLVPLWKLGLAWGDLPPEPLGTDGSMLHAVERLLPMLCEHAGLDWGTVFRAGVSW